MIDETIVKKLLSTNLTRKQIAWCQHFAVLNNSSAAARVVYDEVPSKIQRQALRNLHNPDCMLYVQYLRKQMVDEYKATKQYCTKILKQIINDTVKNSPTVAINAVDRLISLGGFDQKATSILNGQISINIVPKKDKE